MPQCDGSSPAIRLLSVCVFQPDLIRFQLIPELWRVVPIAEIVFEVEIFFLVLWRIEVSREKLITALLEATFEKMIFGTTLLAGERTFVDQQMLFQEQRWHRECSHDVFGGKSPASLAKVRPGVRAEL